LKEHDWRSVADLCRKRGVSDASIYKWKAKFGGMEMSDQAAEEPGGREHTTEAALYRAMQDNAALKDLLGKKW
jgi:putative transposase